MSGSANPGGAIPGALRPVAALPTTRSYKDAVNPRRGVQRVPAAWVRGRPVVGEQGAAVAPPFRPEASNRAGPQGRATLIRYTLTEIIDFPDPPPYSHPHPTPF